jgi:hypothetical protein
MWSSIKFIRSEFVCLMPGWSVNIVRQGEGVSDSLRSSQCYEEGASTKLGVPGAGFILHFISADKLSQSPKPSEGDLPLASGHKKTSVTRSSNKQV